MDNATPAAKEKPPTFEKVLTAATLVKAKKSSILLILLCFSIVLLAILCWWIFRPAELPEGIAKGNGRIA